MRNQQYCAAALVATLLAGCGGGASDAQAPLGCTLGNPVNCGGSIAPPTPPPPTPTPPPSAADPAAKVATVSLVFSSNELASAGTAGSEVTVTALAKTAQNTAVAGARVEFSADSGLLAAGTVITDASGKASATLGTGGAKMNRPIQVSAKAGSQSASGVVNVTGTRLTLSSPAFMNLGSSADLIATLVDSADRPIAGATVLASTAIGNGVQVAAKPSDSRGQVTLQFSASKRGNEQLTLNALGASATRSILVGGSDVTLTPSVVVDTGGTESLSQVVVGSCAPVGGSYMIGGAGQSGSVTLNASRGQLFRDPGCSTPLAGPMTLVGGAFPQTWIRSDNAGVSSIEARVTGGPSGSTRVEFVAALRDTARVNLQSDVALVGSGERSTLIAVVRDGTAANNLVKGATVQFSILADPSGGNLLAPLSAVTGSDGIARAVFVAGPADGGKNGTVIQARIAELPTATGVTSLTVNKKALSIQFGTGNQLVEFSTAVLQKEFAVFVSDSAGNPVPGVAISAAAWPTSYRKGYYEWVEPFLQNPDGTLSSNRGEGSWQVADPSHVCANEDVQRKGLYEAAYDANNNGVLEPGIPLSVTATGKTDALGMTTVTIRYPRDRGTWVKVELTVSGTVAGTESQARNAFWLPPLAKDLTAKTVAPPGRISPYGMQSCTSAD
ncbi:Ig-like domain-containing protein [Massilia psychrophila]|uniref:Big-1 domain-containing protein n=1 Tax=Massilia psychrophila TaxID=1603353 RepID=A0A2G8SYG9_9BURK|nr:Ig-like domain-containing protein [Massilia psychrophila]PIL38801.1 hypothetical protein CR103_15840 [Massilia psychrophila]GGE89732.1 hypothetical protein GCM10008020_38490 [Massilia psychrophila]